MKTALLAAVVAVSVLAVASGADAKGPPSGFQACGQNACVTITPNDAEALAIKLFYGDGSRELFAPKVVPGPFYTLRWHFEGDMHTGYYVPALNLFRYVGDPASPAVSSTSLVHWMHLDAQGQAALGRAFTPLQPYARPTPTRVTVGGRDVADPESYLRLWSVGKATYKWPTGRFLKVVIASATPSPWTDGNAHLSIARRSPYLLRDGTVVRISAGLARQIRARVSLR
jgi:hypothetical protein